MLTLLQLLIVVPYICLSQNHFYEVCLKISEMEENAYQLFQHELEVHEVMRVHREEGVFPSIYPCSDFMNAAGILWDFQTLISNAGLEHFIDGEPHQSILLIKQNPTKGSFNLSISTCSLSTSSHIPSRSMQIIYPSLCVSPASHVQQAKKTCLMQVRWS
jgi:hypothetical protein